MSFLDRYLTVWILAAMALGVALGNFSDSLSHFLGTFSIGSTSIPIAIGLIAMMIPPLAKVRYEEINKVFQDRRVMVLSLLQNWIVGPILMFILGWIFLADSPDLFSGLILIGLARCIAMVIVWNDLAEGSREYTAALIGVNSVFQLVAYAPMTYLFLTLLPQWVGIDLGSHYVSFIEVAKSVAIYLGTPFVIGYGLRKYLRPRKGAEWYDHVFLKTISPLTLIFLLLTIVLMFTLQGKAILAAPSLVVKVSIPLLIYFLLMFFISFGWALYKKIPYEVAVSLAFTAGSNNFELAIAVAISLFGIHSPQAFTGVIGPLIEVPVMLGLVHVALWTKKRLELSR